MKWYRCAQQDESDIAKASLAGACAAARKVVKGLSAVFEDLDAALGQLSVPLYEAEEVLESDDLAERPDETRAMAWDLWDKIDDAHKIAKRAFQQMSPDQ